MFSSAGDLEDCQLQRLWSRRPTLTGGLLDEAEDIFPPAGQEEDVGTDKCPPGARESEVLQVQAAPCAVASSCAAPAHQYPVLASWIDPRVVVGFRYRVRLLDTQAWLFSGRALALLSIGRGYARRLTFEADNKALNHNDNYFWSDSRPEGFAFELEVVSAGDKMTLLDARGDACAAVEVVRVRGAQEEVSQRATPTGGVEKSVNISTLAKVEWFDGQPTSVMPVAGVAVMARDTPTSRARLVGVSHVTLGAGRRGLAMSPGVHDRWRRTTVLGDVVKVKYTIVGLEPHELPVIGTHVDPRITPGFEYRVRPASWTRPLFSGRPMLLLDVGRGYARRLTFRADAGRLNSAHNYLWSDTHPEGLGLEPRAVHAGMRFSVEAGQGRVLGVATVFRADRAQQEVAMETVKTPRGAAILKHVHVDVTCHMTLSAGEGRGGGELMRVSGRAVLSRSADQRVARLVKIEDIGLDSQLNMLFIAQQAELVFMPM